MNLNGKKILFIGPEFFNYEKKIIQTLEDQGAFVDYYAEKFNGTFYGFCKNYAKNIAIYLEHRYINRILQSISEKYDLFFLIRGEIITENFIQSLKLQQPNAIFVMYQWDSKINNPQYINLLKYFDVVSTFDMIDAKTLNIRYIPLFFTKEYEDLKLAKKPMYDIVFFGSYHGDRLEVLKSVIQEANKLNLKFYFHLYIPKTRLLRLLIYRKILLSDIKYLSLKKVDSETIQKYYKTTKVVLDIENKGQNGLTMRTLEVLGASLKLLTTNRQIVNEVFYDKCNISILDRTKIQLDIDFFNNKDYKKTKFIKRYTLSAWIEKVLEIQNAKVHHDN